MSRDVTNRRLVARDACTWCGHDPHAAECAATIRLVVKPEAFSPCPCRRHEVKP